MPGPSGTPAGDLFITLKVAPPKGFKVVGDDLYVVAEIDIVTASLGGTVDVPVVDLTNSDALGKAKLKIPAGTQYGARLLIRGRGMPRLHGHGQGDVMVQVMVTVPKKLTKRQKDLLEALGTL